MATTSAAVLNGLSSSFLTGGKKSQALLAAPLAARVGGAATPKRFTVVAAAPKKSWLPGVRGGGNLVDPEWLDGSLPGDYGFDPLGLGKDPAFLKWYREAELIHGRWAMAAVLGIFVGQAWSGIPWFEAGADPGAIAPFSFGTLLGTQLILMGWVESKRWVDFFDPDSQSVEWATPWSKTAENFANFTGEQGYPGGKFFDPLALAGTLNNGVYVLTVAINNSPLQTTSPTTYAIPSIFAIPNCFSSLISIIHVAKASPATHWLPEPLSITAKEVLSEASHFRSQA